jgi:predicted enzyme related to lactoylglutathione lyase
MELTQTRLVTSDVAGLASFYAALVGVHIVANDYYVEVPTGAASVAFSRRHFIEPDGLTVPSPCTAADKVILDFQVDNIDRHYERVDRLCVTWIMPPTTQPWGRRSMMFRDPEGNLVNLCSAPEVTP